VPLLQRDVEISH